MGDITLQTVIGAMSDEAIAVLLENMASLVDAKSREVNSLHQMRQELVLESAQQDRRISDFERLVETRDEQLEYWQSQAQIYKEQSEQRYQRWTKVGQKYIELMVDHEGILQAALGDDWTAFNGYVRRNLRIDAIKVLRHNFEIGLKEAKYLVDSLKAKREEIPF